VFDDNSIPACGDETRHLGPAPESVMSSFIVNNTAALKAALSHVHSGDVVELSPGTYTPLSIKGLNLGGVTVTSQDPAQAAVLTGLAMDHVSGLSFNNLEFSFPMGDGKPSLHGIFVNHSHDVHFVGDEIHGVLGVAPTNDVTGVGISNSTNVSIENSELQYLRNGVTMGSDSNVLISGNNFHDMRIDGVDGAAVQNATVTGNNFSNFHHIGVAGAGGDHSDAIQFWTTNQHVGSSNLTITDNLIVEGQGRPMQGIFIQDSKHKHPYANLQVTDNLIVGGNWNGIMVDDAHGAVVSSNQVTTLSGQSQKPWIKVQHSNGVSVNHNSAHDFAYTGNQNVTKNANHISGPVTDQGVATITAWLANHPQHVVPMGPSTAQDLVFPAGAGAAAAAAAAAAPAPDMGLLGQPVLEPSGMTLTG
jgi:nitrous oxidase accessory protein NosD